MRIKNTILLSTLSLLFFASVQFCAAQTDGNWQPLGFISGTNSFKGVDAYCQPVTCNGTQVILMKFVNHNSYSVRAGWKDMFITKDNRQLMANVRQDSVTIPANSEIKGDCTNGSSLHLAVKLSDFGPNAFMDDLNYIVAIDFGFAIVR